MGWIVFAWRCWGRLGELILRPAGEYARCVLHREEIVGGELNFGRVLLLRTDRRELHKAFRDDDYWVMMAERRMKELEGGGK